MGNRNPETVKRNSWIFYSWVRDNFIFSQLLDWITLDADLYPARTESSSLFSSSQSLYFHPLNYSSLRAPETAVFHSVSASSWFPLTLLTDYLHSCYSRHDSATYCFRKFWTWNIPYKCLYPSL